MKIQVLSIEVNSATSKAGKPYEQVVVAYKDLDNGGKVASKTIMPFGFQKDTFVTLKGAKPVEVFDVEVQKNEAGYNDWIKATRGSATAQTATSAGATPVVGSPQVPAKGGWETPAERAQRQVYIIRQSSLSTAVAALQVGRKGVIEPEEVIKYARQLENYVFSTGDLEAVVSQDVGTIETIPEDPLPF